MTSSGGLGGRITLQGQAGRVWSKALSLIPPAPYQPRGVVPSEAGQFIESHFQMKKRDEALSIRKVPHKNYSKKDKRMLLERNRRANRYYYTPPLIEYKEEDEMRKVFYDTHPFELSMPKVLVESEETMTDKTEEPSLNDSGELSGESVIRHVMYLVNQPGSVISREEAFKKALKSFYLARAREDVQAQSKRAQRINASLPIKDPSGGRPWSLLHLMEEEEHLKQSNLYLKRLAKEKAEAFKAQRQAALLEGLKNATQ